jgi:hypothetical protein
MKPQRHEATAAAILCAFAVVPVFALPYMPAPPPTKAISDRLQACLGTLPTAAFDAGKSLRQPDEMKEGRAVKE